MTPKEIVASTGMHPNNVWQPLFKMVKDGEAVKVGRGQYRHPDHPEMATPRKDAKEYEPKSMQKPHHLYL